MKRVVKKACLCDVRRLKLLQKERKEKHRTIVLATRKKATKCVSVTTESEDNSPLRRQTPKAASAKKKPTKSGRSVPLSTIKITPNTRLPKNAQMIRDFFGISYTTTSNFPGKKVCHKAKSLEGLDNGKLLFFLLYWCCS